MIEQLISGFGSGWENERRGGVRINNVAPASQQDTVGSHCFPTSTRAVLRSCCTIVTTNSKQSICSGFNICHSDIERKTQEVPFAAVNFQS